MSRVAKKPIELGKDLTAEVNGRTVTIKGKKGTLTLDLNPAVEVKIENNVIQVAPRSKSRTADALAGTTRAHLANMVTGVSAGFEKKLELVGVGYRANVQGKKLNLTLGYSHPIEFPVPEGVTIETPSQNEIIVKGIDRQQVGQVAAILRDYRPPEPYKGKGVKYADERIELKEAKKK
jgi:large subunit ribosomal protein L6